MEKDNSLRDISQHGGLDVRAKGSDKATEHNNPTEWKPSRSEWLIFLCLAVISLIVSLDSSILGPALPVSAITPLLHFLSVLI
jgi:hypothetical protein